MSRPSPSGTRRLLTAAVTGAIALTLAGCSGSGSSSGALTYWFGATDQTPATKKLVTGAYVTPFEKTYPKDKVDLTLYPAGTVDSKTQTALAAGQGPDLVTSPGPASLSPYVSAGYLADLSDLSAKNGWKDRIFPWALQVGTIDGKLRAIPTAYETLVLYYNKTLFQKHGWQPPTDRASIDALISKMRAAHVTPFAAGNASYQGFTEIELSALLNQLAGPAFLHDALTGKTSWASPQCVTATSTMADWFQKGYFGGGTKQYFTSDYQQVYKQFAAGTAGMYLSGSWEVTQLPQVFGTGGNAAQWGWVPLPPLTAGLSTDVYPLAVGGTLSINAAAKNQDAAENYLTWLYKNPATQWQAVATAGAEPLPIPFTSADVPKSVDPRLAEEYSAVNTASKKGLVGYVTYTSLGSTTEAYVAANDDKLISGDVTPQAFCAGMQTASQTDLKKKTVPAVFATSAG